MSEREHISGQTNGHALNGEEEQNQSDEEISLIDVLLIVVRNRRLIAGVALAFGVLGLVMVLFSAREYTSSAKLIRELQADANPQNFSNLSFLRGFGVDIGGSAGGLTPDAYPDIVKSREVRLAVVQDTMFFPQLRKRTTFVEYANRPPSFGELLIDYTVRLPWTVKDLLRGEGESLPLEVNGELAYPTEEEEAALKDISKMLKAGVDPETGLMTISVSTRHPRLSAEVTQSFVDHLVERVREIRTQKARRDLEFIQQQFGEAAEALREAENELASFEDRNNNIQRARLLTEQARLQRQVSFKSDLYSSLQAQLTQAQISLQRSEPVITLLERPVPPLEPSGASRLLTLIWFIILGGGLGTVAAFVKSFIQERSTREEERVKLEELQAALQPHNLIRRFTARKKVNDPSTE